MMKFIWGRGHKTIKIPDPVQCHCRNCGATTRQQVSVEYDYDHIFWLFKGLKNEAVTFFCSSCQRQQSLPPSDLRELFSEMGGNPIPLIDRVRLQTTGTDLLLD
jgi:hypothetical protein